MRYANSPLTCLSTTVTFYATTRIMSTKPKFLTEIEKKLSKSKVKKYESIDLDPYQEIFSILIDNVQTFGPVLLTVKNGYENYIRNDPSSRPKLGVPLPPQKKFSLHFCIIQKGYYK